MAERSHEAPVCACAPVRFFGEPPLPSTTIARQALFRARPTVIQTRTPEGWPVCWLGRRAVAWIPAAPVDDSEPQQARPKRGFTARLKGALELLRHG
jgi:hypothetical protein